MSTASDDDSDLPESHEDIKESREEDELDLPESHEDVEEE